MDASNKNEIISLFENYRYNLLKERDGVLIFEYASGMYSAVEIVPVSDKIKKGEIEKIKEDYSRAGYATHLYENCDIQAIQRDLFNGFFQTKLSNNRIKTKYREYCASVMMQYGKTADDYKYIEGPFEQEYDFRERKTQKGIVDSLFSMLQGDGARLIILEAPAGFGKTSTTYEVLSRFQDVEKDVRPFMMELYKDRTAQIFKYVMLSNIDRDFDVSIKSEIVIDNIKTGRIPLLVDGFDELLSRDINSSHKVDFNEVESMLSTIAELLEGNAKILLTSRKTAIFSGEEFYEWYEKLKDKGLDFHIVKYNLNNPTISDWLEKKDIEKYGNALLSVLNNPVLLGFIRYCGDGSDDSETNIVKRFLDLLLNREIDRQNLPFSVAEQQEILRRLAMSMAGFNCTSDTRAWIMSLIEGTSRNLISSKVTASRDVENILNTLTNHALLNRKNDKIGFLNDFILGTMLAQGFMHYPNDDHYEIIDTKEITIDFLDKCIKAAVFFEDNDKKKVSESIKTNATLDEINTALCDWKLNGECDIELDGLSFGEDAFVDVVFGTPKNKISKCTFSNIDFSECTFNFNYLEGCTFVQCKFEDCVRDGKNYSCYNYGCVDDGILRIDEDGDHEEPNETLTDDEMKVSILQKYFMVGSQRRRMKLISIVRKDYLSCEKQFKRCLDSLESNRYLIINGDKSFITDDGVQWVQSNQ